MTPKPTSVKPGRPIYVVMGHFDCDCKPCKTNGFHIWAVVGNEIAAARMCIGHDDMWYETHTFNDRVEKGHKVRVIN